MSDHNYWQRTAGRRLSRRGVLRGSAVAGLGLAGAALIGCGDDDDDDEAAPAARATAAAPAPAAGAAPQGAAPTTQQIKRGGTYRRHNTRGVSGHYDPHTALNDQLQFWHFIGNFGTEQSQDGTEVVPELVESWEIPGDGTEMILKVRSTAKWHDRGVEAGRALDAEDAVFNLLDIGARLKPERAAEYHSRSTLVGMADAEAIDEQTLRVTFDAPSSTFLPGLSHFRSQWASKEWESSGGDWTKAETLVGTGPFTIEEFTPDQRIVFKANPNYWKPGLPALDEMRTISMADNTVAITAFAQGDLEEMGRVGNKVDRQTIQKLAPDAQEVIWNFTSWLHWRFQTTRKPFDDPRVRRALFLVPDYAKMSQEFFGEGYSLPVGPLTVAYPEAYQSDEIVKMPGYNPDTKEQDRKDAADLLAAAGFPDGDIDFGIMPIGSSTATYYYHNMVRIQGDLKAVWPKMSVDFDIAPDVPSSAKRQSGGNFDTLSYTIHGLPDGALELNSNFHTQEGLLGGRNYGRFSDAEADRLMELAATQLDFEERKATMRQVQDILLELMPTIGVTTDLGSWIAQDYVRNTEVIGGRLASGGSRLNRKIADLWLDT